MNALDLLFDSIDYDLIQDYVKTGQQEDLHLDFKVINDPKMDRDDRKTLAKAMSGFANSDGGIIVWGVEASTDKSTGIDCAQSEQPIADLQLFISRLGSLTGEAVAPLVDGVVHEAIDLGNDSGFAKTLIPVSDAGPHMAKAGEGRYFKRSGDSFYRMEHYDIEDMFGRRKKPVLRLATRAAIGSYRHSPQFRQFDLLIYLSIVNEGRGSAKAPFLSLEVVEPYAVNSWGLDGNRNFGLPMLDSSRGTKSRVYGASSDFVIHPDTSLEVTVVSARVIDPEDGHREIPELKIHYKLAAEDAATVDDTLVLSSDDLSEEIGSA